MVANNYDEGLISEVVNDGGLFLDGVEVGKMRKILLGKFLKKDTSLRYLPCH